MMYTYNISWHVPFSAQTFTQTCVSASGEVCQFGFRRSSFLSAQRVPGSLCQLSEHQRRSVGNIAQHPPGSGGEQHGPQRGTMFDLQFCSSVNTTQKCHFSIATLEIKKKKASDESGVKIYCMYVVCSIFIVTT